jgi:fructose-1,6-bisphosphatase/inositol monophosphatase family enzyme
MKLSANDLSALAETACEAALKAGEVISSFTCKHFSVKSKLGGDTPASQVVTEVDMKAEQVIVAVLQTSIEQYSLGLLTEESLDTGDRLSRDYFWCVDPIDGTLSFIEGIPGYAVSIALVAKNGEAVIGVVFDPLSGTLYSAIKGQGAYRNRQRWQPESKELAGHPLTLAIDRSFESRPDYPQFVSMLENIANKVGCNGLHTMHNAGAVLNACHVLENSPGCYFKLPKSAKGGGNLWDFAATTCLFNEMHASATDFYGQPINLNRPDTTFMNESGVFFTTHPRLIIEIRKLMQD